MEADNIIPQDAGISNDYSSPIFVTAKLVSDVPDRKVSNGVQLALSGLCANNFDPG